MMWVNPNKYKLRLWIINNHYGYFTNRKVDLPNYESYERLSKANAAAAAHGPPLDKSVDQSTAGLRPRGPRLKSGETNSNKDGVLWKLRSSQAAVNSHNYWKSSLLIGKSWKIKELTGPFSIAM